MKRCPRCKHRLPRSSFGANRKHADGLASYCRPCQRRYTREHYGKNKPYYIAKAEHHRAIARTAAVTILREAKKQPCADCHRTFPYYVMDFDHVPGRGKKVSAVSHMADGWPACPEALRAEIAKCDVVCANCHRERTHKRLLASSRRKGCDRPKVETHVRVMPRGPSPCRLMHRPSGYEPESEG